MKCGRFETEREVQYRRICQEFIEAVGVASPAMLQKPKSTSCCTFWTDNMRAFGPACGFNTEKFGLDDQHCPINTLLVCSCKCESYLSLVRHWNVYSNRQAPSRDIADAFMKLEHLRFVCSGGLLDERRSDCAYLIYY